jgi:hypothetical protein
LKNRNIKVVALYILVFISAIPILKHGWYIQDDYLTLGYANSINIYEASSNIISWLYDSQHRFQPVRLALFTVFSLTFDEKTVVLINILLHGINTLLVYSILKLTRVKETLSTVSVILFGCTSIWRMIESPSAMLGGDGLVLFFISLSTILLIKSIDHVQFFKRILLYSSSLVAYTCAYLSYETAYPLLLILILIVLDKNGEQNTLSKIKFLSKTIAPFVLVGIIILILFKKGGDGYEGATVNLSFDIFKRVFYYTKRIFEFGLTLKVSNYTYLLWYMPIFLTLLYFILRKINNKLILKNDCLKVIKFAIIFYITSILLFVINNWQNPDSIMNHHLYIPSLAAALLVGSLYDYFFYRFKYKYWYEITYIFLFIFLILSTYSSTKTYVDVFKNAKFIESMRDELVKNYDGSENIVILGFNDYRSKWHPIMSGMNGAIQTWLKKGMISNGTDPSFTDDQTVTYKLPLTYYQESTESKSTKINNTQFFFINEGKLNEVKNNYELFLTSKANSKNLFCSGSKDNILREEFYIKNEYSNYLLLTFLNKVNFEENFEIIINNNKPNRYLKISKNQFIFPIDASSKYFHVELYYRNNFSESRLNIETAKFSPFKLLEYKHLDLHKTFLRYNLDVNYLDGFYNEEHSEKKSWRWSQRTSSINLNNNNPVNTPVLLSFNIVAPETSENKIFISGISNENHNYSNLEKLIEIPIILKPGTNKIDFNSNYENNFTHDPRKLSFAITNLCISVRTTTINH